MVELAVALVVILVLFAGLLQVGRMANVHTQTMIKARYNAGQAAMSEANAGTMGSRYILSWSKGLDGKSYTADDIPFPALSPVETATEIASAAHADEIDAFAHINPFTTVQEPSEITRAFFLVSGYAHESVPTLPVIRSLLYNRSTISIESRAWLAWTRGIY